MTSEGQSAASRHYERPPIVEAVINILVAYPDGGLTDEVLKAAFERFAPRFEHKVRIGGLNLTIGSAVEASSIKSQAITGWRFANDQNNRILQIRQEGFAYSHLTPYSTWEELRSEAEPLWAEFVAACKPRRATRLAVKFINQLTLPRDSDGNVTLEEYLTFHPRIPEPIHTITGFMSQVQVPLPELSGQTPQALVTVASQPPPQADCEAAVLDIDVFENIDMAPHDPKIWEEMEKMRHIKNRIFESAITDRLRGTFS